MVIASALKIYDMSQELVRAAWAPPAEGVLSITLPQIRFASSPLRWLSFLTSFDELVVAPFVSARQLDVDPEMFNALRDPIDPTIAPYRQ